MGNKYELLGEALTEVRGEMSIPEFIKHTGLTISKQYLNMAESGKTKLAFKHLKLICDKKNVPMQFFEDRFLEDMRIFFRKEMG